MAPRGADQPSPSTGGPDLSGVTIDGRALARELLDAVRGRVAALGRPAGSATLLIGDDEAARIYQRRIHRAADGVELDSRDIVRSADASLELVAKTIAQQRRPGDLGHPDPAPDPVAPA